MGEEWVPYLWEMGSKEGDGLEGLVASLRRGEGGSWADGADISLGTGGGKGKDSIEGAGDHGLISQAQGSLVLACISFNHHHWGLNFSGSVSLAGGGEQLGDLKELPTLPGMPCVLSGSPTLV